jgi:hypothetical protein
MVVIIAIVTYKSLSRKSLPTNEYTPYDSVTMGNQDHLQTDAIQDTKHHVQYEERTEYEDVTIRES